MNHPSETSSEGSDGYSAVVSFTQWQRAELKRQIRAGLPVFRLDDDGSPTLIIGCHFQHTLQYKWLGYDREEVRLAKATSVGANVYRFGSAGMKRVARADKDVVVTGVWESSIEHPGIGDLQGSCEGATHVAQMVQVGAFLSGDSTTTQGGGGIDINNFGASANHERSEESSTMAGKAEDCESGSSEDEEPPGSCNTPLYVRLLALEKSDKFKYYFEEGVTAARTEDSAVTAKDVAAVAGALDHELKRLGRANGIEVGTLSAPSPTEVRCGLSASTSPNTYEMGCSRGETPIFQQTVEREALAGMTPQIAGMLIAKADPTAYVGRSTMARRVVILVDVSLSMVVNDEATFATSDIRRSQRYEMAMLLLRGIQENQIPAEVSVIPFGAAGCLQPVAFGGQELWAVTDESRDHALTQLQESLRYVSEECYNSTDLVGPMRKAGQLLESPASREGKDVIFLITDGAQQAQADRVTPREAAMDLRHAGVELSVIRIQLNDLEDLRTMLNGPAKLDILSRWGHFVDDQAYVEEVRCKRIAGEKRCSTTWQDWLEKFAAQNDDGSALRADLGSVDVSKFIMNMNDAESEALLVVHKQLLPQIGGMEPVYATNHTKMVQVEGTDGNSNVQIEYGLRAIRGRPFTIRIKKPDCMGHVAGAVVTASNHPSTPMKVLWEDGAIVTFEKIQIDEAADGETMSSGITLTLEGARMEGMRQCQN